MKKNQLPGRRQNSNKPSDALVLAILLAGVASVTLAAHWPVLSAKAFMFDDDQYLIENRLVQHPGFESAKRFLTEVLRPSTVRGYYQPLAMISLMLDYAAGGRVNNLMSFHRTSLILHTANTLLLAVLLYLLFQSPWPAALVGLLYGAHPTSIESVAWISERKTLLAAFFALWCLILYLRYAQTKRMWYYILSLAACAVSLLAKPTSVAMPLLLLLLDFWPLRRISIRALLEKLPWFIIAVVSAVITFISQSSSSTARLPEKSGVMKILLTICHNIVFYLYNLVWPANISWYYPFPEPFEVQNPAVITGLVGTAVLLIALAVSLRRTRSMATGWSFFFLAVFPTLGIVGFHPVIAADRHIYFPTTGLLLPLTVGLTALWQRPAGPISKKAVRTVSLAAVILLTASEFILTRCYLVHWQTSENIYRYMLDYSPNIAILHNNLANILSDSGDPRTITQAVRHFETSLKLEPGSPEVHNNLGNALSKLGKNDEAIIEYKKALALRPSFAVAHYNLARTLAELGRTTDAVAEYNQAVKLKPDYVDAWSNLGFLLAAKADYEQAIQCYNTALRNEPDSVIVHGRLGLALAATGKIDQAIDQFRIVLNALPNDQQMHFNLAYLLEKKGQFDQAIEHYRRALEIDPGYAEARQRLEMLQKNRMPH